MEAKKKYSLKTDIRKTFGNFRLDVQFETEGGCLGILGPSGCGKSLTLKAIAGIITPDEGRIALIKGDEEYILYDSDSKVNLRPQIRRVGYLFQNYALFPNMTVAENIRIGLRGRKKRPRVKENEDIERLLKRFRLDGMGDRYPMRLSGGQQQRAALARMMAYEPEVLLFDEPFSAMDSHLREGLRLELGAMIQNYDGVSVLVTHDRDEAYQLCSHMLLLSDGRVLTAGRTQDVFDNPGSVEAARLTGCKNISPIRKLDDHRVYALDWKLELITQDEVTDDVTACGIRAHDFYPLTLKGSLNQIPVGKASVTKLPFEWYITLENGLWWKIPKNLGDQELSDLVPSWIGVDPKAILLLRR